MTNQLTADALADVKRRIETVSQRPIYRNRKLGLLTDLYQLTMMYGHFHAADPDKQVVFDLFYRSNPSGNGYVIAAGLEQVVWYLHHLHFDEEDIDYLKSLNMFSGDFLKRLRDFRFHGSLSAIPEGTLVFPNEPLLRFEGSIFELQIIESAVLSFINHQSLIATKAHRIVDAARASGRYPSGPVIEMGLRRAQNADAAVFGARAAYIGGCVGTSNVLAGQTFQIPVMGTQGHSWIQSFPSEIEAFRAYAQSFPDNVSLLVDTYDVLKSGIPNAIKLANELDQAGQKLQSIRIDSGDLAYLSKKARAMMDAVGLNDVGIIASGDLDEYTIRDLILQGAQITSWGVGTKLITSYDCPVLGAVYKLVAQQESGQLKPTIKISENPVKVTNPGKKRLLRLYNRGYASADLIVLDDEKLNPDEPLELFDPIHTYKRKTLHEYEVEELLQPIYQEGELVYRLPTLQEIRRRTEDSMSRFPSEVLRPLNPHIYHVDLSQRLWNLKQQLLHQFRPEHNLAQS